MDGNIHLETILHADHGMHYTHSKTRLLITKDGLKQSMSRRGNCWDNAPMDSFFGHMKRVTVQVFRLCIYRPIHAGQSPSRDL
nr:DDE-type integrase/transposase/recombinase [Paenibacillus sp. PL91]